MWGGRCLIIVTHKVCVDQPWVYQTTSCLSNRIVLSSWTRYSKKDLKILRPAAPPHPPPSHLPSCLPDDKLYWYYPENVLVTSPQANITRKGLFISHPPPQFLSHHMCSSPDINACVTRSRMPSPSYCKWSKYWKWWRLIISCLHCSTRIWFHSHPPPGMEWERQFWQQRKKSTSLFFQLHFW